MDKQNRVLSIFYNRKLLSHKQEEVLIHAITSTEETSLVQKPGSRGHMLYNHFYEMPRTGKSIETENRLEAGKGENEE